MQTQSQRQPSWPPAGAAQAEPPVPPALAQRLETLARQHGFSDAAALALWRAVVQGGGALAQFDHPELGGHGQWMRGGMLMLGDMFNQTLKARVAELAEALASLAGEQPALAAAASAADADAHWWPAGLHSPASSGAQNGVRYAWFPIQQRLAIERGGAVELYDTGGHIIGGVSQQQSGGSGGDLRFTSQHGTIALGELRRVAAGESPDRPPPAPKPAPEPMATRAADAADAGSSADAGVTASAGMYRQEPSPAPPASGAGQQSVPVTAAAPRAAPHARGTGSPQEVLDTLERLAALQQRGVLTAEEFQAKKAELLGRL